MYSALVSLGALFCECLSPCGGNICAAYRCVAIARNRNSHRGAFELLRLSSSSTSNIHSAQAGHLATSKTELIIGEQSASLSHLGKLWEIQLSRVIYFSEFLLVLIFRPEAEKGTARVVHLVLWPDSLERIEDRRLRRYLRFDLLTGL
tara:strand:+ start:79 stop:522 length:444 start_codon:yes stop_codon:yes gene_type:complete